MWGSCGEVVILLLFGLGAGLFVGAASGTAGALLIPGLTMVMGYATPQAVGTSLAVDAVVGGTAGLIFVKNQHVDLRSSFLLIITGLGGALVGSSLTAKAPEAGLNVFIGLFLLLTGMSFLKNGAEGRLPVIPSRVRLAVVRQHKTTALLCLGFMVGLISGFSGLGGGRMMMLVLILILGYSVHTAVGTSLLLMLWVAGAGAISHSFQQEVVLSAVAILAPAAAAGAVTASVLANKVPENILARVVGAIIVVLGALRVIKTFL